MSRLPDLSRPSPGVFKASTVIFPNVAAMRSREWKDKSGYTYGLHGTPTTFLLEERLCELEGGLQCVLVPSGLAAIATVALALLKPGDEVLIPDNAYGPSKDLANGELARFGIHHVLYDPLDPADLAARITPATRLVWLEAPGSVTMEFPDLCEQVRICRARGVTSALDNTWGAGLAFAPFDLAGDGSGSLAVDISVHALTKYPSGGGDVLMGSVITRDPALHMKSSSRTCAWAWASQPTMPKPCCAPCPALVCATVHTTLRRASWLSGCSSSPPWRRCCIRCCPVHRATPTGRRCAALQTMAMALRRVCSV
jgi:cystathionine beta-lyase/cystathionine gamma-synthase